MYSGYFKKSGFFCDRIHSENETPVMGNAIPVLGVKPDGSYLGYFSRYAYVQPHHLKGLGESFPLMWLNVGLH